MNIEQELLDATGVEPDQFKSRKKFLEAIVKVVDKLPDHKYRALTDPCIDWFDSAVKAMKAKKDPPDFPDLDELPPRREPDEDEPEDDEDDEDEDADEEPEADEPDDEDEPEDDDEPEDEDEPDEDEPEEQESDVAEGAEVLSPVPDTAAGGDTETGEPVELEPDDEPAAKAKKGKAKKGKKEPTPTRYDEMIKHGGRKNRYGIYMGTKADDAIKMFEQGCTMAQVKASIGDSKYNLVRALIKAGHLVEKDGRSFKLTHKDDVAKGPKGKKK